MMSSQERRREKLEKILCRIAAESSSGTVVIVEGRKDKAALRKLGLIGPIVCFKSSGRNLVDFLGDITAKKVIVLTDFDKEGRDLSVRISEELAHLGKETDHALRKRLGALVKQDARTIQSLFHCVERIRAEEIHRLVLRGSQRSEVPKTGLAALHDV